MATKVKTTTTKTSIMGKKLLVERISEKLNKKISLSKPNYELIVSQMLEQIKHALVKGEEIRFPGYFSLKTATQAARMAMNLQTKKKMSIPAKRVPKVKFSDDLKALIAKKK